jgi:hypothetical protein
LVGGEDGTARRKYGAWLGKVEKSLRQHALMVANRLLREMRSLPWEVVQRCAAIRGAL